MKAGVIASFAPLLLVMLFAQFTTGAFVVPTSSPSTSLSPSRRVGGIDVSPSVTTTSSSSTALNVFGPEQALAIEKRKDPKKFEATIQGLMSQKKLTRKEAEKRYGEYLLDPEGFALRAAEAERREMGYKNWEEQAIARSDDPEATRARIEAFKNKNRTRGIIIMFVFGALAIANNAINPYVPPSGSPPL